MTDKELKDKLYGAQSGIESEELVEITRILDGYEKPVYGEIGVYFGGTFKKILDFLKSSKQAYKAYGFDLFEDLLKENFKKKQTHELYNKWNILNVADRRELEKKLKKLGHKNFELIKGSSEKTVPLIDELFDVFFIDGNHTYEQAKLDFQCAIKKCRRGSVIIFDNSSNDIEPDPRYVAADGGPWKLCEELKSDDAVSFIKKINRCSYFKKT